MIELTVSEVLEYLRCPIAYWRRDEKERRQTPPMALGSAVAAAQLWRAQNPEADQDAVEAFALERFSTYAMEGRFSEGAWARGRKAIPGAIAVLWKHVVPHAGMQIEVTVERKFLWGEMACGLRGRIDMLTATTVGDLKVGREIGLDENPHQRQLLLYAALVGEGKIHKAWIDNVFRSGQKWRYRRIDSLVTEEGTKRAVELLRRVVVAINAGVDVPTSDLAWWCSRLWCQHWNECSFRR